MKLLITGADRPLGGLAARALQSEHSLRLTGGGSLAPPGLEGCHYTPADLREPEQVQPLVDGIDAVLHLENHAAPVTTDWRSENAALDHAARGTFVLLHAALKAGVQRFILASRLELMAAHPEEHVIDENWRARPQPTAASLAAFMAELTVREFVRAESLLSVCLRLGELGNGPADTTPDDAVAALRRALEMEMGDRKYRWWLYHICSTDRYILGAAAEPLFSFQRTGEGR